MSAGLPLRPYQRTAVTGVLDAWGRGVRRPAVSLPTGGGKTVTFAHLIRMAVEGELPGGRRTPLVLVHREELAEQAADKIRQVSPGLDVGIVKAERDEVDADVVVGSVQTLARPRRLANYLGATHDRPGGTRRLVVVDECHHAAARTWAQLLGDLGCFTSGGDGPGDALTLAVGFSATMSRADGKGLGDVWEEVIEPADILTGIADGWLVDPRGKAVTVDGLNLADVARNRGDYADGALGDALIASGAGAVVARSYAEHASRPDGSLRSGVLFAPTVATAVAFAADLCAAGIAAEVVVGTTPTAERRAMFDRHRTGATTVLCTAMVLTEGWDAPWCEVAVIARPTASAGLYVQMAGRVLRPWPGKADALILDVVGVTGQLPLRSTVDLSSTVTEVKDGESLAEAVRREAAEAGRRPARGTVLAGLVAAESVDLFHRSKSVWLQTNGGTWFVPTRTWTYFLWPQADGRWRVGRKPTWAHPDRSERGGWLQTDLDLATAMSWGEADAAEVDASVSTRSASWRRKSNRPTDAQVARLLGHRLIPAGTDPMSLSRSEASDLISIEAASADLDPKERRA